jgi:hypothetical protein
LIDGSGDLDGLGIDDVGDASAFSWDDEKLEEELFGPTPPQSPREDPSLFPLDVDEEIDVLGGDDAFGDCVDGACLAPHLIDELLRGEDGARGEDSDADVLAVGGGEGGVVVDGDPMLGSGGGAASSAASGSGPSSSAHPAVLPPLPSNRGRNTVLVDGGRIIVYGDKKIEFVCSNPGHGRCVVTRQLRRADEDRSKTRVVGFGLWWLDSGRDCRSKHDHWAVFRDEVPWPSKELRETYRFGFLELAILCEPARHCLMSEANGDAEPVSEPD